MAKSIWPMLLGWGMLLLACEGRVTPQRQWRPEDHSQPAEADPARTPIAASPEQGGVSRAADALYRVSCASCHGRDGRGQGAERPPGAVLPDFTAQSFQSQRTDAALLSVIRDGRGLMPGFSKQVNEQGLGALVAKVRRFAPSP